MSFEQDPARRARASQNGEGSGAPFPFLLGLWRQLGLDIAQGRPIRPSREPQLFAALQSEIIPRLMIANRMNSAQLPGGPAPVRKSATTFTDTEREEFLKALIAEDPAKVRGLTERYLSRGTDIASLLANLFAWSAAELGRQWETDEVSFVDVTIGLSRLHEALHSVSAANTDAYATTDAGLPSILIASVPGEQHVFGALVVAEHFRMSGWSVATETSGDSRRISDLLKCRHYDLVGLSAAQDMPAADLAGLVRLLRRSSHNPRIRVMMGGSLFDRAPGMAQKAGADGIARSEADPVELARNLLAMT